MTPSHIFFVFSFACNENKDLKIKTQKQRPHYFLNLSLFFFRQKYLAPVLNLFNNDKACIKTWFYEQRPENEDPYFQNNMPTLKRA